MILFFADIFPRHRMFQKHPMSFLGKAGAVCSRCISLNKGTSRHRMSDRHPMSNQNEFRLGKRNRFWDYNISWGQKIISPPVPSCSTLYPVFCRGDRTARPYISQASDVSKTSDVFWQGGRCLFQMHFVEQGFSDIGCLPDIRCLTKMNSVWENEIDFGIIISRRG